MESFGNNDQESEPALTQSVRVVLVLRNNTFAFVRVKVSEEYFNLVTHYKPCARHTDAVMQWARDKGYDVAWTCDEFDTSGQLLSRLADWTKTPEITPNEEKPT